MACTRSRPGSAGSLAAILRPARPRRQSVGGRPSQAAERSARAARDRGQPVRGAGCDGDGLAVGLAAACPSCGEGVWTVLRARAPGVLCCGVGERRRLVVAAAARRRPPACGRRGQGGRARAGGTRGFDPPRGALGRRAPRGRPGRRARRRRSCAPALGGGVVRRRGLAGRPVVVVDHGRTRTTLEPVTATVAVGQARVAAGEAVGRLAAGHQPCPAAACLHWGLKRGEDYLDPLLAGRRRPAAAEARGCCPTPRAEGRPGAGRAERAGRQAGCRGRGSPRAAPPRSGRMPRALCGRAARVARFGPWFPPDLQAVAPAQRHRPVRAVRHAAVRRRRRHGRPHGVRLLGRAGGSSWTTGRRRRGPAWQTVYLHAQGYRVRTGDRVTRGQPVGTMGSTGWSTGCHLHFGVKANGRHVDPLPWLGP